MTALHAAVAVFTMATATAAPVSIPFDAANTLYAQGKFPEAAAAYERMLQSGVVSSSLFFNLGNAFFKSGQVGRAIASYRQAGAITPRDPDLRANLQFVRNQVPGPTRPPNRWERWLASLTLNEWAVLASAVLWAWLLSVAVVQVKPALRPALRTFNFFAGTSTAILCLSLAAAWHERSAPMAIVTVRQAAVHTGPLDEASTIFYAHDGAELVVLDRKDDWLQVGAGDRARTGWIRKVETVPSGGGR